MSSFSTYSAPPQPSQIKSLLAFALALGATFALGFSYGIFSAVSPLIYINFLVALAFGIGLAYSVKISSKLFPITDQLTLVIIAGICGLVGLYLSWVAYILYFIDGPNLFQNYFMNPWIILQPIEIFKIIQEMNEFGMWEIFGVQFKGVPLTIIWLIEAILVIFVPIRFMMNLPESPYSSQLGKWYPKYVLNKDFESFSLLDDFKADLASDSVKTLEGLGLGMAQHFGRVSVFYLQGEKDQYISLENVGKDREGKNVNTMEVVHLLKIPKMQAKELIDKFHGKKAFFLDY